MNIIKIIVKMIGLNKSHFICFHPITVIFQALIQKRRVGETHRTQFLKCANDSIVPTLKRENYGTVIIQYPDFRLSEISKTRTN